MATKKVEDIESPDQQVKKLEQLSIVEVKEGIIQATRRLARAQEDLKYYKESYGEVIKEEKEVLGTLLGRLEFLYETDRVTAAREKWIPKSELSNVVDEIRDAKEQGDEGRVEKTRQLRVVGGNTESVTADGEPFDPETGELKG